MARYYIKNKENPYYTEEDIRSGLKDRFSAAARNREIYENYPDTRHWLQPEPEAEPFKFEEDEKEKSLWDKLFGVGGFFGKSKEDDESYKETMQQISDANKQLSQLLQSNPEDVYNTLKEISGEGENVSPFAKSLYEGDVKLDKPMFLDGLKKGLYELDEEGNIYLRYLDKGQIKSDVAPIARLNEKGDVTPYKYMADRDPEQFRFGVESAVPDANIGRNIVRGLAAVPESIATFIGGGDEQYAVSPYLRHRDKTKGTTAEISQMVGNVLPMLGGGWLAAGTKAGTKLGAAGLGALLGGGSSLGMELGEYATGDRSLANMIGSTALGATTGALGGKAAQKVGGKIFSQSLDEIAAGGKGNINPFVQAFMHGKAQVMPSALQATGDVAFESSRRAQPMTAENFGQFFLDSFIKQMAIGAVIDVATPYRSSKENVALANKILEYAHPESGVKDANDVIKRLEFDGFIDPKDQGTVQAVRSSFEKQREYYSSNPEFAKKFEKAVPKITEDYQVTVDELPIKDIPQEVPDPLIIKQGDQEVYTGDGFKNILEVEKGQATTESNIYTYIEDVLRKTDTGITTNKIKDELVDTDLNVNNQAIAHLIRDAVGVDLTKTSRTQERKLLNDLYKVLSVDYDNLVLPHYYYDFGKDPSTRAGRFQNRFVMHRGAMAETADMSPSEKAKIRAYKALAMLDRLSAYKLIYKSLENEYLKVYPDVAKDDLQLLVVNRIKQIYGIKDGVAFADIPVHFVNKTKDMLFTEIFKPLAENEDIKIAGASDVTIHDIASQISKEQPTETAVKGGPEPSPIATVRQPTDLVIEGGEQGNYNPIIDFYAPRIVEQVYAHPDQRLANETSNLIQYYLSAPDESKTYLDFANKLIDLAKQYESPELVKIAAEIGKVGLDRGEFSPTLNDIMQYNKGQINRPLNISEEELQRFFPGEAIKKKTPAVDEGITQEAVKGVQPEQLPQEVMPPPENIDWNVNKETWVIKNTPQFERLNKAIRSARHSNKVIEFNLKELGENFPDGKVYVFKKKVSDKETKVYPEQKKIFLNINDMGDLPPEVASLQKAEAKAPWVLLNGVRELGGEAPDPNIIYNKLFETHKDLLNQAIQSGEEVNPKVLEQYPELKKNEIEPLPIPESSEAIKGVPPQGEEVAPIGQEPPPLENTTNLIQPVENKIIDPFEGKKIVTVDDIPEVAKYVEVPQGREKYEQIVELLSDPNRIPGSNIRLDVNDGNPNSIDYKYKDAIKFTPEVIKKIVTRGALGLTFGTLMAEATGDDDWIAAGMVPFFINSKPLAANGSRLMKFGRKVKVFKQGNKENINNVKLTNLYNSIANSNEVLSHIENLLEKGATPQQINQSAAQRIHEIYQEAIEQDKGLTKFNRYFKPIDMMKNEWAQKINDAAHKGSRQANILNNKIRNLAKEFMRDLSPEEQAQVTSANAVVYMEVVDAINKHSGTPEELDAKIQKITSEENIKKIMGDLNQYFPYVEPVEASQIPRLYEKYKQLRKYYDAATEVEVEAVVTTHYGKPLAELREEKGVIEEQLNTIKAQKKYLSDLVSEYKKSFKNIDPSTLSREEAERLRVLQRHIKRTSIQLAFADEQALKTRLRVIDRSVNMIEESKKRHHIPLWESAREVGDYALNIEHVNIEGKLRGSNIIYSKMSPGESKAKMFVRFKNEKELEAARNEILTRFNAKKLTSEDPSLVGFYEIDAFDKYGRKIYGADGKPERVVVSIKNIDLTKNPSYLRTAAKTRAELEIMLQKMLANAGAFVDQARARSTGKVIEETKLDTYQKFLDDLEEKIAVISKNVNEVLDADPQADHYIPIKEMVEELRAARKDFSDALDAEQNGLNVVNARLVLYNRMLKLMEYAANPRPPIYYFPKNHYGWNHHFKSYKNMNVQFDAHLNWLQTTAANRIENGFRIKAIRDIMNENARKGQFNQTYSFLSDYLEQILLDPYAPQKETPVSRFANLASSAAAVKVLAGNLRSVIFNHTIGVATAVAMQIGREGGGKSAITSPKAYKEMAKTTLGKIFDTVGSSRTLNQRMKKFSDKMIKMGADKINPFPENTLMHDIFQDGLESGIFGENIVKNISPKDKLFSRKMYDNLMIGQRMAEYMNRSFSFILEAQRLLETNPKPPNVSRQEYVEYISNEAAKFVTQTQGRFSLAWRSLGESAIATTPFLRSFMTLMSPSFRQLYIWEGLLQDVASKSPGTKKAVATLLSLGLAQGLVGGIRGIPILADIWSALNFVWDESERSDTEELKLRESWVQKIRRMQKSMYKEIGIDGKTADELIKVFEGGIMTVINDKSLAFDGGVSQFISPLIVSQISNMFAVAKKRHPGYVIDALAPTSVGRLTRAFLQYYHGQHLGKKLWDEKLGGEFDMWDALLYVAFSKDYSDIEAIRSEFNDPNPFSSPQQKRSYIKNVLTNGIQIEHTKSPSSKLTREYIADILVKTGYADEFRELALKLGENKAIKKSVKRSHELAEKYLSNDKVKKLVAEYLNMGKERVLGRSEEEVEFIKNFERDITKYYESIVFKEAFNTIKRNPRLYKYLGKVKAETLWDKYSLPGMPEIGSYPVDEQGFRYAEMKFIEKFYRDKGIKGKYGRGSSDYYQQMYRELQDNERGLHNLQPIERYDW